MLRGSSWAFPVSSKELLYRVELCDISRPACEQIKGLFREVLVEQGLTKSNAPVGALRGKEAAAHLRLGKTRFYALLKQDAQLKGLSFRVGRVRLWRVEDLDRWMVDQRARLTIQ